MLLSRLTHCNIQIRDTSKFKPFNLFMLYFGPLDQESMELNPIGIIVVLVLWSAPREHGIH